MSAEAEIFLCQPGPLKGCSACCGLFNHRDISRGSLEAFLSGGVKRAEAALRTENEDPAAQVSNQAVRDPGSHICPFQGFVSEATPGCLIHPGSSQADRRDLSLFGKKICGSFLCPAHYILSNWEKDILIRNTGDWYSYSIAIVDPESFQWILGLIREEMPAQDDGSELFGCVLTGCLLIHASFMNECDSPLFFYSPGEYNTGKRLFTLASDSDRAAVEQEKIRATVTGMLSAQIKM